MEKELKISDRFKELLLNQEIHKTGATKLSRANDTYNKLIDKGIIKKRGFTLRGIEDIARLRFDFFSE
ncbi:MAG: hypothetical protein ABI581_15350 [Sediminibacterium sp.]